MKENANHIAVNDIVIDHENTQLLRKITGHTAKQNGFQSDDYGPFSKTVSVPSSDVDSYTIEFYALNGNLKEKGSFLAVLFRGDIEVDELVITVPEKDNSFTGLTMEDAEQNTFVETSIIFQ